MPGATERAESYLATHPDTEMRFDRVADLVDGFETPFGLELLATAHWVAIESPNDNRQAIIDRFYDWSPRKAQFSAEQVELALERLTDAGWFTGSA